MLSEAMREKLEQVAGGRLALTVLFQKRLRQLERGDAPLVAAENRDPWDIVAEEILAGKIRLQTGRSGMRLLKSATTRALPRPKAKAS
ncbi:MAG TPA: DNA-directed RNA polymerase subunit omega [Planctomycetota bacterium]|nr:DNA-directed RNA polymerase subunit omega [Planctomycetota bacterium]